ncbi:MAG: HU family DNA-binding protein [Terracidiphilus sp.]|jgi:nucleoid DNA-binding protein
MAKSSREGREKLVMRVQAALRLATKKEAEYLVNVFASCLEDTLVEHLAEDGYSIKLGGFGKFIVHHRPPIRRKIGFSGEIRDVPVKRKVKFIGLGRLRQLE